MIEEALSVALVPATDQERQRVGPYRLIVNGKMVPDRAAIQWELTNSLDGGITLGFVLRLEELPILDRDGTFIESIQDVDEST